MAGQARAPEEGGASVGLGINNDHPEIVINLANVKREGQEFKAELLHMARVVGGGGEAPLPLSFEKPRPSADCVPAAPTISEQARVMGLSGKVIAEFRVDADGRASLLRVVNGDQAEELLVASVRSFLERCRFEARTSPIRVIQNFAFR